MSQLPLISAWLVYFLLHSLLASTRFKRTVKSLFPQLFPWYRLNFNLFSSLTLLVPLWLIYFNPGETLWQWQGSLQWLMNLIALAGVAGFILSSKYYDGGTFLGLKPDLSNHIGSADEPLVISPLHRYLRHPWYFFGLLLIWTRDMNTAWFISCAMMTAYFLLGSKLEEKKLVKEYGDGYDQYRRKVGSIIPLPWRYLSQQEAEQILKATKNKL